ncbi:MAG: hypothetical protein LBR23_02875 [Spirochaetaceae bacterium]|jgi:hypothetical protein|nr:hypothetical protein [Spirochaetaceae bacterium]
MYRGIKRFFLLVLVAAAGPLAAQKSPNHQKMYPVDSEIYDALRALYISQGLALPSTTGPWSEGELLAMMGRLRSPEGETERGLYDRLYGELTREHGAAKLNLEASLEMRAHTNPDDFTTQDSYIRPWNYTKPLVEAGVDFYFGPLAYGLLSLPLAAQTYNGTVPSPDGVRELPSSMGYGPGAVSSNVFGLPPNTGITTLDFGGVPYRSLVSLGGDFWYLTAGRDRLSWGPGVSGNFLVGDHLQYHNNLRTSWFNDRIKYTYSISSFAYPGSYYDQYRIPHPDPERAAQGEYYYGSASDPYIRQYLVDHSGVTLASLYYGWNPVDRTKDDALLGVNLFIAHRLEWRVTDRVNVVLSEGLIHQGANGQTVDPSAFIPSMVLHNLYRKNLMNSILCLEADWTVMPRLNIYGQIVVDEFTMPGEKAPEEDGTASPPACGYMLGVKTVFPWGKGMFTGSFEAVYTDPYLYLRSEGVGSAVGGVYQGQVAGNRGVNFVVANRYRMKDGGFLYQEDFLGYRWGGDAIVLNARGDYRVFSAWSAGANLMFMAHGTHDKWTAWDTVYSSDSANSPRNYAAPTSSHDTANHADATAQARNAVSYTTAVSFMGSWNFWKTLSLYGEADFVVVANYGNIRGNTAADVQVTLGVTYSL